MKVKLTKGKKVFRFNIPEHWNELTLGRYQRINKVLKDDTKIHDIEKVLRIISAISDIPKRDLYVLDLPSIGKLGGHLTKFLESEPEDQLQHIVEIDNVKYGFHPKLQDMTLGEFIDLETYIKDIDENLHLILSVLYRPIIAQSGDKYRIEEYEPNRDRADLFKKKLTVKEVHAASVFFYDLERELMIHSQKSLKEALIEQKNNLEKQ
ncbi:MAG: hypothetical protein Unbinned4264contig1000_23 [Prokaryotic dsDNA virus sp.]|nr:MAG: hypothetical protein Unbinned4264contig1000_23 [Prokaryotic dsDNA virus sp.]|tara:strand:+ start:8325 stop:8948 length:624 start_codon:yes stop_codon:yes gene_type:complete